MGLALSNGRLSLSTAKNAPPIQKIKPARPSIAEDAIFISKPHKRVDFKLQTSLPNGDNIAQGNLGKNGLTATSNQAMPVAQNGPRVVMEVSSNPQKDFTAIATQEEGRQTHNAKTVNFTQAYDAYGRPRMGCSREPYDFAATKFVSKTSDIRFQENMKATRAEFKKYLMDPANKKGNADAQNAPGDPNAANGANDSPAIQLLGAKAGSGNNGKGANSIDPAAGKIAVADNAIASGQAMDGMSAKDVAEKMGMDAQGIMVPKALEKPDPEALTPIQFGSGAGSAQPDEAANAVTPVSTGHETAKAAEAYTAKGLADAQPAISLSA